MKNQRVLDGIKKVPTTLKQGLVFVGNLEGRDNFIVHGAVVGNSDVDGALMLGPHSTWRGNIAADVVVIKGKVQGNVTARLKLELRETAVVIGNLASPLVAIARGAKVQGRVAQDSCVTHFVERRAG